MIHLKTGEERIMLSHEDMNALKRKEAEHIGAKPCVLFQSDRTLRHFSKNEKRFLQKISPADKEYHQYQRQLLLRHLTS